MTIRTRVRQALNASCSRASCFSPGVLLAVLAVGALILAPHWRGLLSGLEIAAGITAAALAVWSAIRLGKRAGRRAARREAARLAGVSAAYAGQLSASACKWSRPESAAGHAQSDLPDAASRRAVSSPSRWQEESAPFRAPADVPVIAEAPAAGDREAGRCQFGPLGNGRQYASLEELEQAARARSGSEVLERSRTAMAGSEALLEQAGVTWRSPAARQVNEENWRRVPPEQAWRAGARSNRGRGPSQAAGPRPATDPITGAPIAYDEAP